MSENIEEKLDSPLVVHKEDDASYQEAATDVIMSATHTDEESSDEATLERHRFKKKKKNYKGLWFVLGFIAVAVAVVCALFYSGKITLGKPDETTTTRKSYTTQQVNRFEGVITLKGTYIFFEGTEVDGLQALEREIKYLDKGTKYTVQLEDSNNEFLNDNLLPLLAKYGIDYKITRVVSSGLVSKYETTTQATVVAETTSTTVKSAESSTKE